MRRPCVFCGSSPGRDPRYARAAVELARLADAQGTGLVFGGGSVGLMGVLADSALAAGGEIIGVIPHGLAARELAPPGCPSPATTTRWWRCSGHAAREGFVSPENRRLVVVGERPEALLERLREQRPPAGPEWIAPDET